MSVIPKTLVVLAVVAFSTGLLIWIEQRQPDGVILFTGVMDHSRDCTDARFDLKTFLFAPSDLRAARYPISDTIIDIRNGVQRAHAAVFNRLEARRIFIWFERKIAAALEHFSNTLGDPVRYGIRLVRFWIGATLPDPNWLRFKLQFDLPQHELAEDVTVTLPKSMMIDGRSDLHCAAGGFFGRDLQFIREHPNGAARPQTDYETPTKDTDFTTFRIPHACVKSAIIVDLKFVRNAHHTASEEVSNILKWLAASKIRALEIDRSKKITYQAPVDLYLSRTSYRPDEEIEFHVHSSPETNKNIYSLEIYRHGSDAPVFQAVNLLGNQASYSPMAFRYGADWPISYRYTIPHDWPSGYYIALASVAGGASAAFPFVVAPRKDDHSDAIALIASTNTWEAYNPWGEGSFYYYKYGTCVGIDYSSIISTRRPQFSYASGGDDGRRGRVHLFPAETQLADWFTKQGIPFVVYDDAFLDHDSGDLLNRRAIVLTSHPEYYTTRMYDNLEHYLDHGGNLLYLGGNAISLRITWSGDQMEKHEDGRIHDLDGKFGGYWSANLGRSQATTLGVEYDSGGYNTVAPFKVLRADHPIFAGTGLQNGDVFGIGASGHETDKISKFSPPNLIHLAQGINPNDGGADMVIFDAKGGGKVFSVGSISFALYLSQDPILSKILRNAVNFILPAHKPPSALLPAGND